MYCLTRPDNEEDEYQWETFDQSFVDLLGDCANDELRQSGKFLAWTPLPGNDTYTFFPSKSELAEFIKYLQDIHDNMDESHPWEDEDLIDDLELYDDEGDEE